MTFSRNLRVEIIGKEEIEKLWKNDRGIKKPKIEQQSGKSETGKLEEQRNVEYRKYSGRTAV